VLPGILRDEDDALRLQPFTGKVMRRTEAEPPFTATLVIGPHDLNLRPPFDPD
jgi:hypothetical protein